MQFLSIKSKPGTDEIISIFSFNVQILSSTLDLLSSDITLLSVLFYSFNDSFLLSPTNFLKYGETLPSCWHGFIICFADDYFFIFSFLNNGVVPFDIESHEGCTDGYKLFVSYGVVPFSIKPNGRGADDFILFVSWLLTIWPHAESELVFISVDKDPQVGLDPVITICEILLSNGTNLWDIPCEIFPLM